MRVWTYVYAVKCISLGEGLMDNRLPVGGKMSNLLTLICGNLHSLSFQQQMLDSYIFSEFPELQSVCDNENCIC